jgi:hypothetical protein
MITQHSVRANPKRDGDFLLTGLLVLPQLPQDSGEMSAERRVS